MGFWSDGYWSPGWWAEGYWSDEAEVPSGSTLYADRVVTVVRFDLVLKDGSGTDTFYVSEDYWSAESLFESNPEIYPVVAEPVATPRSFDGPMGIRHDVQIALYGKTHFDRYGRGFVDLVQLYQVRNSTALVLRYLKSKDGPGVEMGTDAIRHTLELTGVSWDAATGILRVNARDTWYDDREVSKKLDPAISGFENTQEDWQYEYGAIPFGLGNGGNGVIIDAPYLETDPDWFAGWAADGHQIASVEKFYVRNSTKSVSDSEWIDTEMVDPYSTPVFGDATRTDIGNSYPRHLSLYSRAQVYTPVSGQPLGAIMVDINKTAGYWAADFSGSNNLFIVDPSGVSPGDSSFGIEIWLNVDTLRSQGIWGKGNSSDGTMEWFLRMNSSNKFAFGISADGSAFSVEAVWGTAASASTWYHVWGWFDSAGQLVGIAVNDGTPVTQATSGTVPFRVDSDTQPGPLQLGYIGGTANHYDGKATHASYYNVVPDGTLRSSIYNGGSGKGYEVRTDADKTGLVSCWPLGEFYGQRRDVHSSRHFSDAGSVTTVPGKLNTTITADKGELSLSVYQALYLAESDTYSPDGTALRVVKFDPEEIALLIAGGYTTAFPMDPPLPLVNGVPYMAVLEWSNTDEHAYSLWCNYQSDSGHTHYARLNDGKNQGWAKQTDIALAMEWYVIGEDGGFTNETGGPYYAHFNANQYEGGVTAPREFPEATKGLEVKVGVRGLQDDGSGTYTGSASAIIDNPSDIIRFVLLNDDVFLAVPSGEVDLTSFSSTRSTLGTTYDMSFAVDRETFGDPLIRKICEQSETVLIKSRNGKLTHTRETFHFGSFDHILTQAALQHELRVLSVVETPIDHVYNDFRINFGVDPLKTPKDPAFIRRAGGDTFSATVWLNPSESSGLDANRQAKLAESQERYGVLQYRAEFDCYAADSQGPEKILERLVDKHCFQTVRVTISVPLKDFYDIDLMYKLSTRHVDLPRDGGTSERFVWSNDGAEVAWHNNGVPVVWMKLGKLEGQVVALVEQDQDMQVTFETQNAF